ncbi:MAG: 30S ribosomal protein S12 methylthiotransferase RimO [Nitrospirota bacterium]
MNISLLTLGCPKNQVDSENLLNRLLENGLSVKNDPDEADVLLINTCGFIEDAKKESIDEILKLSELKNNGKKLIVFGCLSQRYRNELLKEIPEIDAIFGVGEENRIVEYCESVLSPQSPVLSQRIKILNRLSTPDSRLQTESYAYLKIAEGCSKKCTFCVIPSIRGPFRSFSPESILEDAENKIESGIGELILVAQDITSYSFKGYGLSSILKDITSIKGDFYVRLLYLYPSAINDELLQVISSEDKIYKYLDIPLQHSEDRILRLMGRRGTRKEYLKLIRKIRRMIPGIALRTTFIVGFPGETEEDFLNLKDFVEEVRFDKLGVFKYSKEEGTPAYRFKGHLPESIRERRFDEIMRVQAGISLEKNQELIGKRFRAIVDEIDGKTAIGRIYSQTPEIDGITFVEWTKGQKLTDTFLDIEITDASDYDLKGVIIKK